MYNRDNLIYLAGIFDGEGWFSIQRARKKEIYTPTYSSNVGVANTNKVLIDWLVKTFGGSIQVRNPHPGQLGKKVRYEWRINSTKVKEILPQIIPYLICKSEQAEIILKILALSSPKYRKSGVPKDISIQRENLYLILRKLNNTKHKIIPYKIL